MKPSPHRSVIVLAICAIWVLLCGGLWQSGFVPIQQAECFAQDWQARLGRKTPLDDRLVLIGIDKPIYAADFSAEELQGEPVLAELQTTFPWSRAVWARLIEKLYAAGAKVIVFDLVFANPAAGDDELCLALEKYRDRLVIGYSINVGSTDRGDFSELLFPNETLLPPESTPSPVADDRLGYVNVWPDFDNTLRRANFRKTSAQTGGVVAAGVEMESLGARALRKFGRPEAIPAGAESRLFRYTAAAGSAYRPHPVGNVLSPRLWSTTYANGGVFKDKIVIIGPTAGIFHDLQNTPFIDPKPMGGPEIHLQMLNAALHGEFLRDAGSARLWIIALAGVAAAALSFGIRQPGKRLLAAVGVIVGYGLMAQWMHDRGGWVIPLAVPLLVVGGSGLMVLSYDFALERLERMKLRHTMGLYFSPRILEVVLADPGSMQPRRAEVTLLLTDLRNSTPLAEVLDPQGMFELLNRVFEIQTRAIMAEDGNLEHFLGDQFLSYWGAPQDQPDATERALRAATCLITAMEKIRPTLSPEVAELFGYGVALHHGGVLMGNKGSAQRLDYGLVGDAVNEAARIESLTKYYGVRLLLSQSAFDRVAQPGPYRLVDRVIVKGKSGAVVLMECRNPCSPPNHEEIFRRYEEAYAAYVAGDFASALERFEILVREFSDGPSRALASRCRGLMADPPASWNGIWKMDSK